MIHHRAYVHGLAFVHYDDVYVGAGSKIWQFASVLRGTVIGEDCNIGACAVLSGPKIGDRTRISSGCVMGPGFKIGNEVFIGPNVVLANDVFPYVDRRGYDEEALIAGRYAVIIDDGAAIGANVVILPGIAIGAGACIGAGAVVDQHVPPGCLFNRNREISLMRDDWRDRRMKWAI